MGAAFAASAAKAAQSTGQFVTASIAARDAARQQAIAAEQQQVANLAAAQNHVAAAQAVTTGRWRNRGPLRRNWHFTGSIGRFVRQRGSPGHCPRAGHGRRQCRRRRHPTLRGGSGGVECRAAGRPPPVSGCSRERWRFWPVQADWCWRPFRHSACCFRYFRTTNKTVDDLTLSTDQYADALRR